MLYETVNHLKNCHMPAGKKKTARKKSSSKKTARKAGKKTAKRAAKRTANKKKVSYIPAGTQNVIPYLTVRGGVQALDFYKKAFGAKEKGRMLMPDGKLGHGEIQIGDCRIMIGDEAPEWGNHSPQSLSGTPVGICIYVRNVDAVFAQALKAGARVDRAVEDQFYGDRSGSLVDPFGHKWTISTHKEDISFREMQKRATRLFGQG